MTRPELGAPPVDPAAAERMTAFQADTVAQVRQAVASEAVVVVGMGWNPHVRRARRALDEAGVAYHYIGVGNYVSGWPQRLGIKLWSGWPTFPQVFVKGTLIGGADQTEAALASGELKKRLEG